MMISLLAATLAVVQSAPTPPVQTDEQAAALGQCFVEKTTGGDRIAVMRWVIGAIATAPQLADLVTVNAAQKDASDRKMAGLFTRLMTTDCAKEAKPLLNANNTGAFETAGDALGRIAMKELLANPAASQGLGKFTDYLRESDFDSLKK